MASVFDHFGDGQVRGFRQRRNQGDLDLEPAPEWPDPGEQLAWENELRAHGRLVIDVEEHREVPFLFGSSQDRDLRGFAKDLVFDRDSAMARPSPTRVLAFELTQRSREANAWRLTAWGKEVREAVHGREGVQPGGV